MSHLPHAGPRPRPATGFRTALHGGWGVVLVIAALVAFATTAQVGASEDSGAWNRSELEQAPQRAPWPDALDASDAQNDLFDAETLHEIRLRFEEEDWERQLRRNHGRALDTPADLEFDGRKLQEIGVRYKGNTSLEVEGPKKPFNLTLDSFVPGQQIEGVDVLNLNNGWGDPSMVREAIAYTLLRDFMPVPRVAYSRVFVNDRYIGVYLMVEQIERDYLATWFPTDDGLLVKADDPSDTRLNSSTLRYSLGMTIYERGYEIKGDAEPELGLVEVQRLARALDAPLGAGGISNEDFEASIREHLDVDRALWYLAANNLLSNYDSYYAGHNYYLYRGDRDRRWHLLNWDWSLSFGTFQAWYWGLVESPRNIPPLHMADPFDQAGRPDRPLTRRLLSTPAYRADYASHYRTLLERVFTAETIGDQGREFQNQIREAVREEPEPLQAFADFERNLHERVRNPVDRSLPPSPGVLALVSARRSFLTDAERWPDLVSPTLDLVEQRIVPQDPIPDVPLTITAVFSGTDRPVDVELRYRIRRGAEQRLSMARVEGEPSPATSSIWRVTIPPVDPGRAVDYAFRARFEDERVIFFPESNLVRPFRMEVAGVSLPQSPPGDLIINELMADNERTLADAAGHFEDWIEILNRGAAPVGLAGYFLSDAPSRPWEHPLPDIVLLPGERHLVYCDNALSEGPDHAPFRLSRRGETVVLSTLDEIVDRVEYPEMPADESYGRRLDGEPEWVVCQPASPGKANDCRYRGWVSFLPRVTVNRR